MSMEFPTDYPNAYHGNHAERQFLWGSNLLFVPIVEENATVLEAYFPYARWYQFHEFDGNPEYTLAVDGEATGRTFKNVTLELDEIAIYVRGGKIVPFFTDHARNTVVLRKRPLTVLVALDSFGKASGTLYWDDGETFDTIKIGSYSLVKFEVEYNKFTSRAVFNEYKNADEFKINRLTVLGVTNLNKIRSVTVNGKSVRYSKDFKYLSVTLNNLDLNSNLDIEWTT